MIKNVVATLVLVVLSLTVHAGDLQKNTKKDACSVNRLVVIAKLSEIPGAGEFTAYPKNSIYYYHIDILRYEVIKVLKGSYDEEIIMVGQYIPLVAREKIKDDMDPFVDGDVIEFKAGDVHKLVLEMPITKYWEREDAIFDDYFDDEEGDRYYALRTDLIKNVE